MDRMLELYISRPCVTLPRFLLRLMLDPMWEHRRWRQWNRDRPIKLDPAVRELIENAFKPQEDPQ
jgi:hypothetical protein